ncbi:MAG: hypothetical protein EA377_11230 [Phycisphaerales bacterium]|nr:MAG: hypothetical protein EA377_11230 [Phycisphaerales bacterium]
MNLSAPNAEIGEFESGCGPTVSTGRANAIGIMMLSDVLVEPAIHQWPAQAAATPSGEMFGHAQSLWREKTRLELGLATDRPIIATGHQTLLWHPGILAKYLAVDLAAAQSGCATANLVVDQHVGSFASLDVPIRLRRGGLRSRTIELAPVRDDVPMGLHESFEPRINVKSLPFAHPSVEAGMMRIVDAVQSNRNSPNAALQMAGALAALMSRWVAPMPNVTASALGETSLARALMQHMMDDPHAMAHAYNEAVRAFPDAGIPPLLVRDDYVEVPLWRLRPDGRRMRAYDNDLHGVLDTESSGLARSAHVMPDAAEHHTTAGQAKETGTVPILLPRALFMTALVRLGMCDLFVHGTGGAIYDRAMERWIRNWLGVKVAPVAVVTATVRLPLEVISAEINVDSAWKNLRRVQHDPDASGDEAPSAMKRTWLKRIEREPRRSAERRQAFFDMHRDLAARREEASSRVDKAREAYDRARCARDDAAIAERRDWPFPLYPDAMIDDLRDTIARIGAVWTI